MNVTEMRKSLEAMERSGLGECELIMACDPEGNGFAKLAEGAPVGRVATNGRVVFFTTMKDPSGRNLFVKNVKPNAVCIFPE